MNIQSLRTGVSLLALMAVPFSASSLAAQQADPVTLQPVVVEIAPLKSTQEELVEGSTVLTGDDLERRRAPTLGETLARTPGVANSDFGPGAGRPVIRGQGAARVRVHVAAEVGSRRGGEGAPRLRPFERQR